MRCCLHLTSTQRTAFLEVVARFHALIGFRCSAGGTHPRANRVTKDGATPSLVGAVADYSGMTVQPFRDPFLPMVRSPMLASTARLNQNKARQLKGSRREWKGLVGGFRVQRSEPSGLIEA
jgi:hypothetical protein